MTAKLKPVHPGEILLDELLLPNGLSQNRLAQALRVPTPRIGEILYRRSITPDTALRLGRYFGTTPEFWMNLQAHHNLELARRNCQPAIRREVKPLREAIAV